MENENENNLSPVCDPWIVTHSNTNSNSNSKGNKNKENSENNEDDTLIMHQSDLSSHVYTATDRVRTLRRSIESINDAVGMLEVGCEWMKSRNSMEKNNRSRDSIDNSKCNNDIHNDNNNDAMTKYSDKKTVHNNDHTHTNNKQKNDHNEKNENSIKGVKSGRWSEMGALATLNNENLLNSKLRELEQDEDWLFVDKEHSAEESPTQKSSQQCSLMALFDKMELTKSSQISKNINLKYSGIKVLSPLAMIGMNLSESEEKMKNDNENENENDNIHDDDLDNRTRNDNRISTPYSENNESKIYGNESGEENERRGRVDGGDGVGLESRRLYLDSSSSPDAATPHSFSSFPLSPALSLSHSQPLSVPLLHHTNRHTEYQIMEERKSITHERRKRRNVWNRFVDTTSQSDTVVTNVSPLILNVLNVKNVKNGEKNSVKEMQRNSGSNNENKNENENTNVSDCDNENQIEYENEIENPWCHILPHTNPQYRVTEIPVYDTLQISTHHSRTSEDGNRNVNSDSVSGGSSSLKFTTSLNISKNKTLIVDTHKSENKDKNEFNKLESQSTSILGMNFHDGGVSTVLRSDDVRDSGSRRKSSFGSREALDSNGSSPLPFSPPSSNSIFSLDSLSSPASLLSSPQFQLQQRTSIGSPSLVIDTKEKQSEITTKNKSLTSPESHTKKSPVDPAKSAGTPTVNTVKTNVTPPQSFSEQVTAFYLKHNPTKVDEIPKLLEKYRGQEPELIRKLEKKYGVVSGITTTGDTAGTGAGTGIGTGVGAGAGAADTGAGKGEKVKEGNSTQSLESPALTAPKPSITRSPGSLFGSLGTSFGSALVPSLALSGKRRPDLCDVM